MRKASVSHTRTPLVHRFDLLTELWWLLDTHVKFVSTIATLPFSYAAAGYSALRRPSVMERARGARGSTIGSAAVRSEFHSSGAETGTQLTLPHNFHDSSMIDKDGLLTSTSLE